MTILGAIVGANKAANAQRNYVSGYRLEQRCENVAIEVIEPIVSYYNIQYTLDGIEYHQETTKKYTLGQRVKVQVYLK